MTLTKYISFKGAFGEVWLAQAFQINQLDPRNKTENAMRQRAAIRKTKKVEQKMDKEIREGRTPQLVAIKKILGI